jgi:hypothetical protein
MMYQYWYFTVQHQGHPCPAFEVVTANEIRNFRCPHVRCHYTTVLLAMNDLYTNKSQLLHA